MKNNKTKAKTKTKKKTIQIAPSLLACDWTRLKEEIQTVEKAGADLLHLDVMDGHFVPNLSFGFPLIEKIRSCTKLPLDAHLMITNPQDYILEYQQVGCNWLSVHIEACPHIHRIIYRIRELGMKAGVAINPGTSLSTLEGILFDVDFVLVMSVNPGFGGQKWLSSSLSRVETLKKKCKEKKENIENTGAQAAYSLPLIEVDGGINPKNAKDLVAAGADVLVVGTTIFGSKDYKEVICSLHRTIKTN